MRGGRWIRESRAAADELGDLRGQTRGIDFEKRAAPISENIIAAFSHRIA